MVKFFTVQFLLILTVLCSGQARAWNNSGPAFSIWPDTGQTTCYDASYNAFGYILDPCPAEGQPLYGQDAQYAGPARFYTKLDGSDNALPESAASWTMVRDNVTGLIWEGKRNRDSVQDYANPHDADNTYTWCDTNPAANGGNPGICGANGTEDFLAALNNSAYGGYTDWRLPTIKELKTLVDRSRFNPSISTAYFPNKVPSPYWSSTTNAGFTDSAWLVHFYYSTDGASIKSNIAYVRAVRGGQVSPEERFVVNGATVLDTVTCLEWQRATADVSGDGAPDGMSWQDALAYAEGLSLGGYTDWRLPDINELISIVDYSRFAPAIDTAAFPNIPSTWYWTSTTNPSATSQALVVDCRTGQNGSFNRTSEFLNYVRAVRGGQCKVNVRVRVLGNGKGVVTAVPGEIDFMHPATSEAVSTLLALGTEIVLTATADEYFTTYWLDCASAGGIVSGNGTSIATCSFSSLDSSKSVTAILSRDFPWPMFLPAITNSTQP